MRPNFRITLAWIALTTLGAAALAAEPDALKKLEDRLAIERAQALASRKLYDRAEAILRQVAEAKTAASADAQKKLDTLVQERKRSDSSVDAPSAYRDALADARKTCRPLFVFFGRETCGNCQFTKANLAKSPLPALLERFQKVMLDCDAAENDLLLNRLRAGQDMKILPFIFYVSPRDELIDFSSGGQDIIGLKSKMMGVLKRCPPVNPQRLGKLVRSLQAANVEMLKGNCGAADGLYREIAQSPLEVPAVDEAKASLLVIGEQAEGLLKEGLAANDRPAEAAVYLAVLARRFAGTRPAAAAKEELAKFRNNPDVQAVLQAAALTEKTPATASTAHTKASTDPPSADVAKETNPPKVRADPAKSLLDMAKNLIANHRADKATPLLERILKEFPDSPFAADARKLLDGLE